MVCDNKMSVCVNGKKHDDDDDDLGNNENVLLANGCFKWQNNNESRDASGSQEMFFDDDQARDTIFCTPKPSKRNDTLNSSALLLKTPILCSNAIEETPGKPKVPRTPVDLLPFIKKTSFVWTSDMETPESKANERPESCNKTANSIDMNNATPLRPQCTPEKEEKMPVKASVSSPVLGGKKRTKRRVKRRILTTAAQDEITEQQHNLSSNSDPVPSETASSVSNDVPFDIEAEVAVKVIKENKKLEDAVAFDKNSNTSTQDFFCNASFSTIDQLCNNAISEEKEPSAINNQIKVEKEETVNTTVNNKQELSVSSVSDDVLERVAAIKRNRKPIRRSMDIPHTVIPREVFSKSVMELELADMKFSQEKGKTKIAEHKPLKMMSFSKFSDILNETAVKVEKSSVNELESNSVIEVPEDMLEEWNKTQINKENIENLASVSATEQIKSEVKNTEFLSFAKSNTNVKRTISCDTNNVNVKSDNNNLGMVNEQNYNNLDEGNDGFLTASGKNIAISEDKILDYAKVYSELENENLNENSFFELKNKNNEKRKLQLNFGRNSMTTKQQNSINSKAPSVLLAQESTSGLSSNINNKGEKLLASNDGFATAGGKSIAANEEKESLYKKIYNDLDDTDQGLLNTKKSIASKSKPSKGKNDKAVIIFNNKIGHNHTLTRASKVEQNIPSISTNDGFATAGGRGIKIDNKRESEYKKIYEGFDDVNESNLLNIKEKNISKGLSKPTDKAVLVFNKPKIGLDTRTSKNALQSVSVPSTSRQSSDGFATAGGKGIKINDEKANHYLKLYNEMDDTAIEQDLLGAKKNKLSNLPISNTKNLIALNQQKNKVNVSSSKSTVIKKEFSSDGFATAGGKGIKVNEEKEKYYSNVMNELSDDINFADSKSHKHEYPKIQLNNNAVNHSRSKPSTEVRQIKAESASLKSKLSMSSDTDDALLDLVDMDNLFETQNIPKSKKADSCFTVPNSANVPKKSNHTSNIQFSFVNCQINQINVVNASKESKLPNNASSLPNHQEKSQIGRLKRKLEGCEAKKPERCRSFGGFPLNESVSAHKLNKSDPLDVSAGNLPLQNGLSVSQRFDSHSDSFLYNIELSCLNASGAKSSEVRAKTKVIEPATSKEFAGFSYKDQADSMRSYISHKKFLDKFQSTNNSNREISLKVGEKITFSNQTLSERRFFLHGEDDVAVRIGVNQSSFVFIECPANQNLKPLKDYEPIVNERVAAINNPPKEEVAHKIAEKRKHVDTDSDNTPLTTVKKAKVGSELQGRRLFSDESDAEEQNQAENPAQVLAQPVQPVVIEDVDLSEERLEATLKQEKMIRNKKRMKIKPAMGQLLRERLANGKNRQSWSDAVGDAVPRQRSIEEIKRIHPDAKILEVTAANATSYKFLTANIVGNKKTASLGLDDGAVLVFDEQGHAGVNEFTEAFLAMPGVDPKLLPNGWPENHYRWIVWKLACMDRMGFGSVELPKALTAERVMRELKYRYDREIDKAQRPALRRILEKDDPASRRMVLCISSIKECTTPEGTEKEAAKKILGAQRWKVEASDGWYDIPLTIDNEMANLIASGRIKEGTKICTYGAELLDCERGFFPLEKPPNVSLKIHANSSRRARWYARLGYQKSSAPIPVKLRDILTNGGMVGETTAAIARVYPIMYREKTADGRSVYRNARCEERAAIAHEKAMESKVDAMYAEAEKNFGSGKSLDEELDTSQASSSSSKGHNHWERKQEEFKRRIESQVRQTLPAPREVTAVLKARLLNDKTTVTITIWGASEDSEFDMREGQTISVYNAFASGSRGGEVNLTANRITHIKPEPLIRLPYPSRICTLIPDIGSSSFDPKFSEFDTVGVVVSSGAAPHGMRNFEMVNFAYPRPNNTGSAYLTILFWNGVSSFGYQGMFVAGTFLACSNLEWRRLTSWNVAVAYCSEKTVFTTNPRQSYLMKELRNLKSLVQHPISYAESCVEELTQELAKKPQSRTSLGTPSNALDRTSFYNSSIVSPMDNNFSPAASNSSIQRRLEMLSRYGSTPDVSPIVLSGGSADRLRKDYTPVTRSNT